MSDNTRFSDKWASNLLANPNLRKQLCVSAFRKFDAHNRQTGTLEPQELLSLTDELCERIGLVAFSDPTRSAAYSDLGKDGQEALAADEFALFFEKALEIVSKGSVKEDAGAEPSAPTVEAA